VLQACLREVPEADPDADRGDRRSPAVPARAVDPASLESEPFASALHQAQAERQPEAVAEQRHPQAAAPEPVSASCPVSADAECRQVRAAANLPAEVSHRERRERPAVCCRADAAHSAEAQAARKEPRSAQVVERCVQQVVAVLLEQPVAAEVQLSDPPFQGQAQPLVPAAAVEARPSGQQQEEAVALPLARRVVVAVRRAELPAAEAAQPSEQQEEVAAQREVQPEAVAVVLLAVAQEVAAEVQLSVEQQQAVAVVLSAEQPLAVPVQPEALLAQQPAARFPHEQEVATVERLRSQSSSAE